jgi:hypothetical protein
VVVQRERLSDSARPHYLEAHRVGETEWLVAVPAQPSVRRRSLQVAVDEDNFVGRILVEAVEKAQSFVSAAKPTDEDLHLSDDEIGRYELDSLVDPLPVGLVGRSRPATSDGFVVLSEARAERGYWGGQALVTGSV